MKKMVQFYPRRFFTNSSEKFSSPPNIVRVRVWRSGFHDRKLNQFVESGILKSLMSGYFGHEPNIGHVSIELDDVYVSLWPDNLTVTNKIKPQDGSLDSSAIIDEQAEGRPADSVVDFETLDINKIKKEVQTFEDSGSQYHLIGNNRFFNKSNAHNCSGLAYKLLFEAGLNKFVIPTNYFRDYMIVTPNNFISYLESAKKYELDNVLRKDSQASVQNIRRD